LSRPVTAMPMPAYPVLCYRQGCTNLAAYKIAAAWSDGVTQELKTYALCCADCLKDLYHLSCRKQAACRLALGEKLERPGIFEMVRGKRDQQLVRLVDLETLFNTKETANHRGTEDTEKTI
jgi:hypothetical protein